MDICHLTINHIDYERRIKNQAESSKKSNHNVWIVALGEPGEPSSIEQDGISVRQLKTPFYKRGPLKFIHYNLKLFFFLIFKPLEILHCHDLWILPAVYSLRLFKKCRVVYDAHEYFEGLEIFNKNKIRKNIWMLVEKKAVARIDVLVTVSEPIARLYKQKYPGVKHIEVIRNLPKKEITSDALISDKWPVTNKKIIVFQGHFKPGRGLLKLIEAMASIDGALLVLIGGGELEGEIQKKITFLDVESKVLIIGYIPTNQLIPTASKADLGVVLFEPTSINYRYALPNKFFEYIMAGIPVLASNIETFVEYLGTYKIGKTVDSQNVKDIAETIKIMLADEEQSTQWKKNSRHASNTLNWENESLKLKQIYEKIRT
jgi:glycosyltransferase involved in cell wall biosynthesis